MRNKLLWILFAVSMGAQAASLDSASLLAPPLKPVSEQPQAAHMVAELLTRHHYKALPLDDAMSEKIFNKKIKMLIIPFRDPDQSNEINITIRMYQFSLFVKVASFISRKVSQRAKVRFRKIPNPFGLPNTLLKRFPSSMAI